jgi:hypothetical protein
MSQVKKILYCLFEIKQIFFQGLGSRWTQLCIFMLLFVTSVHPISKSYNLDLEIKIDFRIFCFRIFDLKFQFFSLEFVTQKSMS